MDQPVGAPTATLILTASEIDALMAAVSATAQRCPGEAEAVLRRLMSLMTALAEARYSITVDDVSEVERVRFAKELLLAGAVPTAEVWAQYLGRST